MYQYFSFVIVALTFFFGKIFAFSNHAEHPFKLYVAPSNIIIDEKGIFIKIQNSKIAATSINCDGDGLIYVSLSQCPLCYCFTYDASEGDCYNPECRLYIKNKRPSWPWDY